MFLSMIILLHASDGFQYQTLGRSSSIYDSCIYILPCISLYRYELLWNLSCSLCLIIQPFLLHNTIFLLVKIYIKISLLYIIMYKATSCKMWSLDFLVKRRILSYSVCIMQPQLFSNTSRSTRVKYNGTRHHPGHIL